MNTLSDYKAQESLRAVCATALQASNPHLAPNNGKLSCHVVAAKNIRIELKKAFPGIKFSVTSESFSMGNAVRIHWTDGPTIASVEKITDKYEAGSFDGMEDIYRYSPSTWTDAFGDAKYISTSRHFTDEFMGRVPLEYRESGNYMEDVDAWLCGAVAKLAASVYSAYPHVERMKREILVDVRKGVVPILVCHFRRCMIMWMPIAMGDFAKKALTKPK
jgi:hypothetical protein